MNAKKPMRLFVARSCQKDMDVVYALSDVLSHGVDGPRVMNMKAEAVIKVRSRSDSEK